MENFIFCAVKLQEHIPKFDSDANYLNPLKKEYFHIDNFITKTSQFVSLFGEGLRIPTSSLWELTHLPITLVNIIMYSINYFQKSICVS